MSKVMGIYVKFTKTTHQIWSCHVTLASNSRNFYFSPNSVLNFRNVTKFGGNWLKNKKLQAKHKLGEENTACFLAIKMNLVDSILCSQYILADRLLRNCGYLVEREFCRLLGVSFHLKEVLRNLKILNFP